MGGRAALRRKLGGHREFRNAVRFPHCEILRSVKVAEAIPEQNGHPVYRDAFFPQDGESLADLGGAQAMAQLDEIAQAHGAWPSAETASRRN